MELDPEILEQLVATFGAELEEKLQVITDHLLQLEEGVGEDERPQVYEAIFRAAHNIKGAANGIGVEAVGDLAHRLESMFSGLKQENAPPTPELNDRCLQVLDGMREIFQDWHPSRPLPEAAQQRYEDLVALLESLGDGAAAGVDEGGGDTPAAEETAAATQSAPGEEVEAVEPATAEGTAGGTDSIRVDLRQLKQVSALAEELEITKVELEDQLQHLRGVDNQLTRLAETWRKRLSLLEGILPSDEFTTADALVRENMEALGAVRDMELQAFKSLRATTRRFGQISGGLQKDVRTLQLVEASMLLRPLVRTVRDMARDLGKSVRCELSGEAIRMDRSVLDGVRDPLTHLVRNALDHGLEGPEVRTASGKPEKGTLHLAVESGGGRIRIRVEDDGAGIDPEAIAASAVAKGLLTQEEAQGLDRRQKRELVFRPGFSSRDIITSVSGRGVGLDVVQENIQALKGTVHLESKPGEGSRFVLDLPLTLATERGLVVRVGGEEFAIPSTAVERVMELRPDELTSVEASDAVTFHGRPLPLRDLATVLDKPPVDATRWSRLPVVVISHGWHAVALLVEAIVRDREIVVKRLQPPLNAVRNVSGATLSGSGEIMMVLNAADVVRTALGGAARTVSGMAGEEAGEAPHVLVVDDSITTRMLERNVLEKNGYRVTVATHGKQAWELLQTNAIDLVISDIQMPLMDGFELTETIKSSESFRDIPVIIVSSLGNEADKRRGIEVGADAYIVKSQFETQGLLDLVRRMV